jgi:ribonuclease-3
LGDSIIGFFIAKELFIRFPKESEGALTKMRASLVRQATLATIAKSLNMQTLLLMGAGELKSGGFNRDSVLSDAFESVIGATYLDGGISAATEFLRLIYKELLNEISPEGLKDGKTSLQELLQKHNLTLPIYEVVEETGLAHNLMFTVSCHLAEMELQFEDSGTSRKIAEQKAAGKALNHLKTLFNGKS